MSEDNVRPNPTQVFILPISSDISETSIQAAKELLFGGVDYTNLTSWWVVAIPSQSFPEVAAMSMKDDFFIEIDPSLDVDEWRLTLFYFERKSSVLSKVSCFSPGA